ncbi:Superoxide dismutase [Fe] 3, chloroplastic [Linum grandiflorum]
MGCCNVLAPSCNLQFHLTNDSPRRLFGLKAPSFTLPSLTKKKKKPQLDRCRRASKVVAYFGLRPPPYQLVWNHDFFWESMQPEGGGMPELGVLDQIEKDFSSFANFREKFVEAALTSFGSSWIWLVLKREERHLEIVKTSNAINPLVWDDIPIINLDMWEHAYYLDHKNERANYVNAFMDHLVSWDTAMVRMARAEAFVNLGEPTIPIA